MFGPKVNKPGRQDRKKLDDHQTIINHWLKRLPKSIRDNAQTINKARIPILVRFFEYLVGLQIPNAQLCSLADEPNLELISQMQGYWKVPAP